MAEEQDRRQQDKLMSTLMTALTSNLMSKPISLSQFLMNVVNVLIVIGFILGGLHWIIDRSTGRIIAEMKDIKRIAVEEKSRNDSQDKLLMEHEIKLGNLIR